MGVTLSYSGLGGKVKFSGTSGKFKSNYYAPQVLDLYPNASVAYSLRKLSKTYSGPAIRVRRSSDNAEQDIGFVSNVLDTASLLTFCGPGNTGNGFVTTWYDQSGNSNNLVQTTAANQPNIVVRGTIIAINGKPYIEITSGKRFTFSSILTTINGTDYSLWMTFRKNVKGGSYQILIHSGGEYHWLDYDTAQYINNATGITTPLIEGNILYVNNVITNYSVGATIYRNGASVGTSGPLGSGARSSVFNNSAITITTSEFIFYPTNQTTNRSPIESNINSYYSIYGTPAGTGLIDLYPNSLVACSVRRLSSKYTGAAMRVRRSSDNTEQDIGFVNNDLDTATLLTFCGAGNGFVTIWYDQSNANHLWQTELSQQPQIVSSGTLITRNGKPYIQASNLQFLNFVTPISTAANTNYSLWTTYEKSNTAVNYLLLQHWTDNGTTQTITPADTITISSAYAANTPYINNTITNYSASATIYRNGASVGTRGALTSAAGSPNFPVSTVSQTRTATTTFSEFIFYPTNQEANRTAITNNINSYYTIY